MSLDTLCIFGCFEDNELYSRNRILINALSKNFDSSIEVRPAGHSKTTEKHKPKTSVTGIFHSLYSSLAGFWSLARQASIVRSASVIFIPYPAYLDVFFLKCILIGSSRPILIIDAFLCLHDTLVADREILKAECLAARLVSKIELHTLRSANLIFIDTMQQREQLLQNYDLSPSKIVATPVGIDESTWTPLDPLPLGEPFKLLFWGTFIPLHGIDTIVSSAQILARSNPKIELTIIGNGQTADIVAEQIDALNLDNIRWERRLVSSKKLRTKVEQSHCILGIFGDSDKAGNVIPYKVYQAMASNKIVITRSGAALVDMFPSKADDSGLILVPSANAERLAEAISNVYANYDELCKSLNTRNLYESSLSNEALQSCVNSALKSM